MSAEPPERPATGGLVAALPLRRNVAVGLAVGLALAVLVYVARVFEVFGPAHTRGTPALFLLLAFVLATTAATLVASLLTAVSAYRLLKRGPDA